MGEHPSVARATQILQTASNGGLREVVRYWLEVHPRDRLPTRADFDPVQVPQALRNIALTDVERDPLRFRVRLMGTEVVQAFGRDFTGGYLDEAIPGFEGSVVQRQRIEVAVTGLPGHYHGYGSVPFKLDFAPIERVYLPFAEDGRTVDMILSMTIYMAKPPAGGGPRRSDAALRT